MTFAYPYFLLLLLLLPVLAWLKGKRGQNSAFLYSSVQLVKPIAGLSRSRAGRILASLRWLALASCIVALAQPRMIEGETVSRSSGIDIVIALDLSGSMASEDFELNRQRVNRLVIAKDVLKKFIENRPYDRIGLVAFAGRAYIVSPLTLDHPYLLQNVERLELGLIEDRTAIGSGLMTSLARLEDRNVPSRIVILMTDGVNNAGSVPPLTAAEVAQAVGVKVYTIGVGTHGTAPMPYTDQFGIRRYAQVEVDIDEETLKKMSAMTGGKYYRADHTEALRSIYDEIDQLEKSEVEVKKYFQYQELFGWFVIAGFFLLLLEAILGHTVWRRLP
jgi:Ca-activated chloride channel homolog